MAKERGTYYVYATGRGITVLSSTDLKTWRREKAVFEQAPAWTSELIPGSNGTFWAPDISYFRGKWHLYYSVSTFGKNHSAIGLATNATLDPSRSDYRWIDEGPVIESIPGDDWNAIDPNVVLDEESQPWLAFGSFWSGIKLMRLEAETGTQSESGRYALASRPRTPEIRGAIEAPFIIRRNGFYYLFASFDFCCRGVNSTYNVRVGRAKRITGPYLDRERKPMLEGGGTLILSGAGRWKGPGHNAILRDGNQDWIVYHAYDAADNGAPKLRVEKLDWTADGWPVVLSAAQSR